MYTWKLSKDQYKSEKLNIISCTYIVFNRNLQTGKNVAVPNAKVWVGNFFRPYNYSWYKSWDTQFSAEK